MPTDKRPQSAARRTRWLRIFSQPSRPAPSQIQVNLTNLILWHMWSNGVTIAALAEAMGVSLGQVHAWLYGPDEVGTHTFQAILTALEVRVEITLEPLESLIAEDSSEL